MWQPVYLLSASFFFCLIMIPAYAGRRRPVFFSAAALYTLSTASATLLIWLPLSGPAAAVIFTSVVILPNLLLCLFFVDFLFAPFCLEMRYMVAIWWLAVPAALALNALGFFLGRLL